MDALMKSYTKTYILNLGYEMCDFIPCELCSKTAVDIHHIEVRTKSKSLLDKVENIMAVCRKCHIKYGDKKQYKSFLYIQHEKFLQRKGIKYDKEWITNQINKNKHYEY